MELTLRYEMPSAQPYGYAARQAIKRACALVRCPKEAAVSIIFVGDKKMRELNRRYRGEDKTTNVLAFASQTDIRNWKFDIRESKKYPISNIQYHQDLGDIVICYPEAAREAKRYGWTLRYGVARLALHGFLHLLGFDHVQKGERVKMERIEAQILTHI